MRVLYIKSPAITSLDLYAISQKRKKRERLFFGSIATIGVSSIIFAIYPVIVWQITTLPKLTAGITEVPVPTGQVLSLNSTLISNVQVIEDPDGFSYFVPTTSPPSSFRTTHLPEEQRPPEFLLTIPKLKIQKATVKVDNLNFYASLSHFPGSALPGEVGNSFVTGHSVLPQFADPKNYKAIFTKLSDLEVGDDVFVEIAGQTIHFTIQYKKIVDPHDTSVLLPISSSGRNLTLMTCVPPGTNLKRLVVITSLM